ncbi:MAG: GAF domain-containing protein, partial [Chloroflexi bacterium]|nr:GAF domain-containing protein [Chloroflexota bacterium]
MNTNPSTDQKASQGNLLQRFATSLRFQLSATTILMAVVPLMIAAVALGTLVSNQVRESMTQSALDHLTAIREAKAGEIGSYFGEREGDMAVLVETTGTLQQDAFNQLLALQTVKKGQIEDYLQTTFNMVHALKDNPTTAQAIVEFKQAFEAERGRTGGRQWTAVHEKFNAVFEDANNDFGFYDIFLIAEDGDVIYTVAQEPDLGQNLVTGDLQNSGLGQVFQEAHTQEVAVADFAPYAPTGDLFAAFVAGAVTDITGTVVGVVAIQIPIDKIDAIMQERAGLAETGETYLVGSDNLFRSNSRFVDEDTIINPAYVVDTEATQAALAGNSGLDVILDYRGERVLSAYAPLEITGLDWAILAEIDLVEALAPRIAGAEKDFFTQYKETYGYYDVFLIASDGYIFYTVDHELDYQTNILTGPYQDSNLAALVADVIENQEFGIADFARYEPSQGAPAAFAAAPLLRGDEVEMVVAVQLSLDKINAIMQTTAGLGESGETYLVGPDEMWRSDSRFLVELGVESTVLNTETTVRTEASLSALANEPPGTRIIDDYRGERVLSSWMPLVLDEPDSDHPEGITWAVIAEQDESEALATVATVATFITTLSLGLLGVMAVVAAVVGSWIAGRLVEPIVGLTGSAAAIASGDLDVVVAPSPSRNEVGVLTNSFATMTQQLRDMVGSLRETADNLSERTRELEASQRVTFAASERTSPDELLGLVVDLIRDQFDLYHAQVYLVDDEQEAAVLRESTGYAGSQLLQKGHQIPLDRASLVTRAIHSGEPVLVSDTAEDPNFMPNPLLPETRSELVVPLRIGEQVFGALDAQDMTPGRFTESTVALFRTMADQVAFLFENSDLLSRVTEQTESLTIFTTQLRIAADIAAQLGTVLDPDQLLQQVVELMQSRFGLYHAHIYVLDEATSTLSIRAGSGEVGRVLREEGHAIPLDREKSLVARAARDQEAVLIEDTTLESDFMPNPLLPQTRSELSVPLVAGGRVLGVLDMQDDQSGRFSESDVDTFTTLAGQIAVALQNAGLFERVEAGAQETRVRLEVSQALAGAQTEQDVLDALLQQAGVYPEAQVVLSLYDLQAEEPTLVVASASSFESGIAPAEIGSRFPASQFAIINLLVSGEPLAVSNLSSDERIDPPTRQYLTGLGNASMVITAMVVGDEQIGILRAGSSKAGFFDQHKLHLYQTLAEQGAAALQAARLRAQIQEREARFTGFANATDYGFGLGELSGQLTYANPGLLNILGEDNPEDAYANTFFDYYSEADRKALETEILPIVLEKGQWVGELALLSSKGKLTPTEQNIFLIYDEQGAPRMVANIITDITERKRAEQEIQRSERQYRELNAGLQDGIVSVDLEGNTLSCNPAFEEMTGYSLKDAQERTLLDMTPEKWHAMEAKILEEQVLVRGYSDLYEKEVLHKDGTIFPIEMTAYLSRDEQGNPSGFWAYIRDITERKQAEQEIRGNERKYRALAAVPRDGEVSVGPDGNTVSCTPACEGITGYT